MKRLQALLSLSLALFAGCDGSSQNGDNGSVRGDEVTAFVHANVVPMDEERVLPDQTVLVANGNIVRIGRASEVNVPEGARRIDATGRYLMPALSDMHVHLLGPSWNVALSTPNKLVPGAVPDERFLLPYIANGVTMVQDLFGAPETVSLRGKIERNELLGPRMILARMIDHAVQDTWPEPLSVLVDGAEAARDAVRKAKQEGYDKIKVYSHLSEVEYDAIVATANELGMDVIGHIPSAVSLDHALDAKQKLIAHAAEVRPSDISSERIDQIATQMAASGVWMGPTLVTSETLLDVMAHPDDIYTRPETAYFRHPAQVDLTWFLVNEQPGYRKVPQDHQDWLRDGLEEFERPLTKAFHDKGGKLLAGTDALLPGLLAGFDLHRELQAMVAVGLTPYEALRTATTNPFEYLGESDKAGTIAVGKRTDLLLVDANPLEDISAASHIGGVLMRGRWIGAEELQLKMQAIVGAP
jgi:imidazolonepropionase-like amidohydrolase